MYRYRENTGSTRRSLKAMRHLSKLGRLLYVRGYVYLGRYGVHHAGVLVRGEKGTARFGGFSWGYNGEGPRGLVELLRTLGVSDDEIARVREVSWPDFTRRLDAWQVNLAA